MPSTISSKDSNEGGDKTNPADDLHVREPLTLILPDSNKFASHLFSTFKRSTNTILAILIVVALPVTLVLLSKPQDVRQRAGFEATPDITRKFNISGKIYVDTNNNKTRDSWENGPKGAVILVTNENLKIEVQTDDFGNYSFASFGGLIEGNYTVNLNVPDGYTPITASSLTIRIGPQDAVVDFGVRSSTNQPKPSL